MEPHQQASPQKDAAIKTAPLEESSKKESGSSSLQTRSQLIFFLLRTTSLWAFGGIAFMMIGIISAWIFVKKRVYLCPPGVTCPGSFNPDNSFLQDIRTVMQYCLYFGMLIFGVGLVKLVAYQAWLAMRQQGNTIDILDLNIGVIKGSALDAAKLLLLPRRNRSLGVIMLTHAAIITAISLVVGKSITAVTDTGSVELLFDYPMNISILNMVRYQDQGLGTLKYGPTWAWLSNRAANLNSQFNETFSGTFIVQDSRTEYGVNAQPSGQQISGSVSCVDPSANISINTTGYVGSQLMNITYLPSDSNHDGSGSIALELDPANFFTGTKLIGQYLPSLTTFDQNATFIWFTLSDGIIPNTMQVPDFMLHDSLNGAAYNLFIGLCENTITFSNLPQDDVSGDGMQYINPSQPAVYLPPGDEIWEYQSQLSPGMTLTQENPVAICDDGCMWFAVWNTLLTWWGLQDTLPQTALGMDIYCYGGVLSPAGGDMNQTCPSLDGEIWNRTLALVLDAMIQTYPRVGNASQKLLAEAESIGTWQWWLQGIIPLLAFILYISCLAYTVTEYWAGEIVEELDLLKVVNATHAEEERLTKSAMIGGDLIF